MARSASQTSQMLEMALHADFMLGLRRAFALYGAGDYSAAQAIAEHTIPLIPEEDNENFLQLLLLVGNVSALKSEAMLDRLQPKVKGKRPLSAISENRFSRQKQTETSIPEHREIQEAVDATFHAYDSALATLQELFNQKKQSIRGEKLVSSLTVGKENPRPPSFNDYSILSTMASVLLNKGLFLLKLSRCGADSIIQCRSKFRSGSGAEKVDLPHEVATQSQPTSDATFFVREAEMCFRTVVDYLSNALTTARLVKAAAHHHLGVCLEVQNQPFEALKQYTAALRIRKIFHDPDGRVQMELAETIVCIAMLRLRFKRSFCDAEKTDIISHQTHHLRRSNSASPIDVATAATVEVEVMHDLNAAVDILKRHVPKCRQRDLALATAYAHSGAVSLLEGQLKYAKHCFFQSFYLRSARLGREHPETKMVMTMLTEQCNADLEKIIPKT